MNRQGTCPVDCLVKKQVDFRGTLSLSVPAQARFNSKSAQEVKSLDRRKNPSNQLPNN